MSLKSCAYFNCENYSLNGCPHGHYTIFSFPKDKHRLEEWKKLGKVDDRIPIKDLYMCSEHFEQKYLSVNSVRTNLLKNSVPIPYEESTFSSDRNYSNNVPNTTTECKSDEELNIVIKNADTTELDEDSDGNSHFLLLGDDDNISIQPVKDEHSADELETITIERTSPCAKKILLNDKSVVCKYKNLNSTIPEGRRDVHTFIHKGEEYIQMPKAVYLSERKALLSNLRKYELLFADLKKKLKHF